MTKTSSQSAKAWQAKAEKALISTLKLLKKEWIASVRVVGAKTMRELNSAYRGKDAVTDVLSFEAPPVFKSQDILGELVICLPVLKRQAKERGLKPEEELKILTVHGVLHLLGMDHEAGEKEAKKMRKWEEKLLPKRLARSTLITRALK